MLVRKLMNAEDGNGGGGQPPAGQPPAGAPPPPNPEMQALQRRLQEMEQKEAQYIAALNHLAERVPQDPPPGGHGHDEDQLDPVLEKQVSKLLTPLQQRLAEQADMLDQSNFMQMAAAMGATPQQVGEAEQQYRAWSESGLQTVDKKGNRKTPTRREALAFVMGNGAIGAAMKEAPTRSIQAMRQQLLGDAAFSGGEALPAPIRRGGLNYEEVEKLPLNERLAKREAELDKNGF